MATEAFINYSLNTLPSGRVVGKAHTNDDEDLGYPNTESRWDCCYTNKDAAINSTGGCHYGISGIRVQVVLDGQLVDANGNAMRAFQ